MGAWGRPSGREAWSRLVAVVAVSGVLAGCAGGGGGGGASLGELRAEVEARCRRALREIPLTEPGPEDSGVVLRQKYQQQAELYRRVATELHELEPPRRVAADFARYRAKMSQQAENRLRIAAAQRANDVERFRALRRQFAAMGRSKARLRDELRLRGCP